MREGERCPYQRGQSECSVSCLPRWWVQHLEGPWAEGEEEEEEGEEDHH